VGHWLPTTSDSAYTRCMSPIPTGVHDPLRLGAAGAPAPPRDPRLTTIDQAALTCEFLQLAGRHWCGPPRQTGGEAFLPSAIPVKPHIRFRRIQLFGVFSEAEGATPRSGVVAETEPVRPGVGQGTAWPWA
jgi:hypothetical protein